MAVQFKFRSSVKFDSVDLEGRTSISVRDLKAKILRHKNLNLCKDSDLIFSDAVTGQEYKNENVVVPCGSSVIIKRVPAGSVHVDMPQFSCKNAGNPMNIETVDFDDFGVDVYPVDEATIFRSGLNADKDACSLVYEPNAGITRCLEPVVGGHQKLEASGTGDAIPGNDLHGGVAEQTIPQTKSKPEVQEDFNLEKLSCSHVDTKNGDVPLEMKCSLCNSFFKEAVMIPCCQHSFCEKCIRQVLLEKARCPKCLSTKCRIEDLLPNISLRQAIEHFQESQNFITVPDNGFSQYAPDGESGIQANDVSYCGSIFQRESGLPQSPDTGVGSNNCFAESNDAPYPFGPRNKQNPSLHKYSQIDGERYGSTHVALYGSATFDDFQGESKPTPQKAEPLIKKKVPPWGLTPGGGKSLVESGRNKKGDRACYMCGSPDHLIRECPLATGPRPLLPAGNAMFPGALSGYVPPYWDGAALPRVPPFRNLYGNYGMTAFDNMSIPPTPFSVYPYMHMTSMYRASPGYGGYMGMGGVAPLPDAGEDYYTSRSGFPDLEGQKKRRKLSKERWRDQSCDDHEDRGKQHYNGTARLEEHESFNKEKSVSYSSDGFTKRSQRQDHYCKEIDDDSIHLVDRHRKISHLVVGHREGKMCNSEIDDMPSSSSWHSEEKHRHYHKSPRKKNEKKEQCDSDKHNSYHRSSRYLKKRREQCGSDSSWSHHQDISEKDDKRARIPHDFKRQNHHSNSGSGLGHGVSSEKKRGSGQDFRKSDHSVSSEKKNRSSRDIRKSEHSAKSSINEDSNDRWKMVSGSGEDHTEDYRYFKRKRV